MRVVGLWRYPVKGLLGGDVCDVFIGIACTGSASTPVTVGATPAPAVSVVPPVRGQDQLSDGALGILALVTGSGGRS